MAALFRGLVRPMYSLGKDTLTIELDKTYLKTIDFKKAVVDYLNNLGMICSDRGEKYGSFDLIEVNGKSYLFEKRFLTTHENLSEVAVLIEK